MTHLPGSGEVMDALETVAGVKLPPDTSHALGVLPLPQPPTFAAHKIEGGGSSKEQGTPEEEAKRYRTGKGSEDVAQLFKADEKIREKNNPRKR